MLIESAFRARKTIFRLKTFETAEWWEKIIFREIETIFHSSPKSNTYPLTEMGEFPICIF